MLLTVVVWSVVLLAPPTAAPVAPPSAPAVAPPAAPAAGWTGLWVGRTSGPRTLDVALDVLNAGQAPAARLSLPTAGVLDQDLTGLKVGEGHLRGSWNPGVGRVDLDLAVSQDASRLEGTLTMQVPGVKDPQVLPLRLTHSVRAETVAGAEDWVGSLNLPQLSLEMGLTLVVLPDGRALGAFDVPSQEVRKLPVVATRTDGKWSIVVPLQVPARFELEPKGQELVGEFSQGAVKQAITFKRGAATGKPAAAAAPVRPQTPTPPFPYTERDVKITHPAGHVLAGTLTLPDGASPQARVPAVVLATGSGAQNRNEALVGHEPFRVLADALARAGIAVLRCDDRGVAASTGSFATASSLDFATDVAAEMAWLAQDPSIDPARIGLLGHSEGGLLISLVAAGAAERHEKVQPAFLVFLAGPGVPGHAVLRAQNEAMLKATGVTGPELDELVQAHGALMDAMVANAEGAALNARISNLIQAQLELARKRGQTVPPGAQDSLVQQTAASLKQPWMQVFIRLDPAESLRKVKCPCLVLNGSLDTQVLPSQNFPPIKAALEAAGAKATMHEYPGLNHLFQPAKTGAPDEYAQIETTMDPLVLHDVAEWIRTQTGVTTPWQKAP